ncbi:MAG: hypothetical protein RI972_1144 [Pseudomonadota bacterium]
MTLLNFLPHRHWALARARRRLMLELVGSAGLAALLTGVTASMAPGALMAVARPLSLLSPLPAQELAGPGAGGQQGQSVPAGHGNSSPGPDAAPSAPPVESPQPALAARLLQELARLTPPDVGLREVHWEGRAVSLRGRAGSAQAISAYTAILERESVLVHHVQWGELQGSGADASEPGALGFLLTAQLREQGAAPDGGSRP